MPMVTVELIEGRSDEVKQKIAERITQVLKEEANAGMVQICFEDKKRNNLFRNGVPMTETAKH